MPENKTETELSARHDADRVVRIHSAGAVRAAGGTIGDSADI